MHTFKRKKNLKLLTGCWENTTGWKLKKSLELGLSHQNQTMKELDMSVVSYTFISPSFIVILNMIQDKQGKMYFFNIQLLMMASKILKFADSWEIRKSKDIENKIWFFPVVKNFMNYTLKAILYRGFSKHFLLLFQNPKIPKLSSKTQSSIIYHFSNSYFIGIVEVLFLITCPLEKDFKEEHVFSAFCSRSVFSSNLAGFKLQNFYSLSWAIVRLLWVSLTKINSNHKKPLKLNLLSKNGGKHKCLE